MAVQIPKLKSLGPAEPQSVGRLKVDVPDGTRPFAQVTGSLEKLGGAAFDHFQKIEDDQLDLTSRSAAAEYEVKKKVAMERARQVEGDPTNAYETMNEESSKWQDEILTKYQNVSEKGKRLIQQRIAHTDVLLNDQIAVNRETQLHAFDMKTTRDRIKLHAENASLASETIVENSKGEFDDSVFDRLRVSIGNIKDEVFASAERRGLVVTERDVEGNILREEILPSAKMEMKQHVTDALDSVIKSLNRSGKTKATEKILNEFKNDILSDSKDKLLTHIKDSTTLNKAREVMVSVRDLDPQDAYRKLDKISDLAVQEKAKAMYHADRRQRQDAKDTSQKMAFEDLSDYFRTQQKGGKKYLSDTDVENDPVFQGFVDKDRLSSKQIKAIKKSLVAPEESDEKVKDEVYSAMFNGEMDAWTYGDLKAHTAGLNASDAKRFEKRWEKLKDQSEPEKKQMIEYMGHQLSDQLIGARVIGKSGRNLTNKDRATRTRYYDKMMETIEKFPPGISMGEQHKWVKEFVAKTIAEKPFTGTGTRKFQSAPSGDKDTGKTEGPREMTMDEKRKAVIEFTKEHREKWDLKKHGEKALLKYLEPSKK